MNRIQNPKLCELYIYVKNEAQKQVLLLDVNKQLNPRETSFLAFLTIGRLGAVAVGRSVG